MRIGDAAARLGIESHVLRHWEEVGVLVPRRLRSGHRDYDEDSLDHARLIRVAQTAGMSLAEIREFAIADRDQRRTAITSHQDRLRRQMTLLQAMDGFLTHVGDCVHPVLSKCPECSAFVTYCESAPSRRYAGQITPLCTVARVTGSGSEPRHSQLGSYFACSQPTGDAESYCGCRVRPPGRRCSGRARRPVSLDRT